MEIAIIGAGSQFTLPFLRSLYQNAKHDNYHIRMMDIRPEALDVLEDLTTRLNEKSGRKFKFSFYENRVNAIKNADHVLVSYAIEFPDAMLRTFFVMKNHGIQLVEGETASPGALMATLRHLPLMVEIVRDVQKHADGAWVHTTGNPMSRLVYGVIKATGYQRFAGHCHGTIHVKNFIGKLTDTPSDDVDIFVAGINHFHIVQKAIDKRNGRDLLEALKDIPEERIDFWKEKEYTMWKLFNELGYLIGHGMWHNFDYTPYSNHRMFNHTFRNSWERESLVIKELRKVQRDKGDSLKDNEAIENFLNATDHEQHFIIMQALSGEVKPYLYLSGNMPNNGKIPSLPDDAIVELPATVSPKGIELHDIEKPLPKFFESWLRQHITINELSCITALENSLEAAIGAIVTDPCFRDCDCSPGQLLDEMLKVNKGLVPNLVTDTLVRA
jgi:alpha-galactosidase